MTFSEPEERARELRAEGEILEGSRKTERRTDHSNEGG